MASLKLFLLFYLKLQWRRFTRLSKERGLHPFLGLILSTIIFIGASLIIFNKIIYPEYTYIIITWLVFLRSNKNKTDLIKLTLKRKQKTTFIIIEAAIKLIPPLLFLLCSRELTSSILLITGGLMIVLIPKNNTRVYLQTPFSKHPFEWILGFRKYFWVLLPLIAVLVLSKIYTNPNLGLSSLIILFGVIFSFYGYMESEYFVWNFNGSSNTFIIKKIKIAIKHSTLILAPLVMVLIVLHPELWLKALTLLVWAYAALIVVIMSKYAIFPNEMDLINGLIIFISIAIPPLMLFSLLYYYKKSKSNLNYYLNA
jgi:hypothetical protein